VAEYASEPTADQLRKLSDHLGRRVRHDHRILGGEGGTVDVLTSEDGEKLVLKRFWLPEAGESSSPALSEFRALTRAREAGVPAPTPLWLDETGLFPERAVVTSYVAGRPLIEPDDEADWAAQLAEALHRLHGIRISEPDHALFPDLGANDPHRSWDEIADVLERHDRGRQIWVALTGRRNQLEEVPVVYTHHDFWPGNTLWVDQELVAIIDWEGGCIADPALDVACCAFDIRMLGLDQAASHFVESYRQVSGLQLVNLGFWQLLAACRPMPDIAIWVPGWHSLGFPITIDEARSRHDKLIDDALRA